MKATAKTVAAVATATIMGVGKLRAVTRLSGDVCKVVAPGSRTITWNAGADCPENVTESAKARVTA